MYQIANQNGYETAFIDLYSTKDMWANGYLLEQKLKEIYQYFGEKVVIVAHSKGGVDTQSALIHYGASPYVERVITLASPHHGSQLADLAYSSWAGWLAGILGVKNEATYSLQTGYMDYFRSLTDSHSDVSNTPVYTFGGNKWGSFGTSLYWGGLYLSPYGSNDGAVTVNSSRLPYATEIKAGAWNHSTIREGSSTFYLFKCYLNKGQDSFASFGAHNIEKSADIKAANFVSGGEYEGKKDESIYVEKGAEEINIDWISDQPATELTLISPTNKTYTAFTTSKDETDYLNGSYHHSINIKNPEEGKWLIQAQSDQKEKYLLTTSFESPLNDLLGTSIANGELKVNLKDQKLKVKTDMTIEYYKDGKLIQGKVKASNKNNETFMLPNIGEGVYNMTIDIQGSFDKEPFQRTVITSIYIDNKGQLYYQ
jgi:triacylglycerol lipase